MEDIKHSPKIKKNKIEISILGFVAISSFILLLLSSPYFADGANIKIYILKLSIAYFLIFLTTSIFAYRNILLKIFFSQALLISSLTFYYQYRYGFTINQELLLSILETNGDEVAIILGDIWLYILLLCLFFVIYVIFKRLIVTKSSNSIYIFFASIQLVTILFFVLNNLFSFIPKSSFIRQFLIEYGKTVEPFNFYAEIKKFTGNQIRYRNVSLDYTLYKDIAPIKEANINIVLVIGESARAMNFSLNGYNRKTNPLLEKQERLISFNNAVSCGTSTSFSVPCILSRKGRSTGFDLPLREPSIVEVFKKLGFHTYFYSRQNTKYNKAIYKICKKADICEYNIKKYDGDLLTKLQEVIKHKGRNFIILHTNGSHFLYNEQYPPNFEQFKPVCTKRAYECQKQDAINAYDNSILYTDYVLAKMIESLKDTNAMLLYTSDHGESIGENDKYGHATLYRIAPKEQINVPLIAWVSHKLSQLIPQSANILKSDPDSVISHDNIFHSIVGCIDSSTNTKPIVNRSKNLCN